MNHWETMRKINTSSCLEGGSMIQEKPEIGFGEMLIKPTSVFQ